MHKFTGVAFAAAVLSTSSMASAQATPAAPVGQAITIGEPSPQGQMVLPANTQITVTPNDDLTSKTLRKGDTFTISTVYDVMLNNYIVIPRGTRGVGEITWRTGKGAFGKSAKMDLELRWIDINGRRLTIEGKHRQEGEGNTGATVGAVVAVGPFGAFVTGKSATIPRGMQLVAHTAESLAVNIAAAAPAPLVASPVLQATGATQGTTPAQPAPASAGGQ